MTDFVNWLFVEKVEIYDGNWCYHYDTRFLSVAKPVGTVILMFWLISLM